MTGLIVLKGQKHKIDNVKLLHRSIYVQGDIALR